jgi:hypothetical protein
MRLAERRAMLFNADFWRILSGKMPPFPCDFEDKMLEALARSTKVSPERARAHYDRYLRAYMATKDHLIHPGTGTIN